MRGGSWEKKAFGAIGPPFDPSPGSSGRHAIAARGGRRRPAVAGGGVSRSNLEDPRNIEIPTPPEPLQINLFGEYWIVVFFCESIFPNCARANLSSGRVSSSISFPKQFYL